jgi:hypothetical protein
MDRDEVVTRLVAGSVLTGEERRLLGAFVTRAEVAKVIAMLLGRYGRFPLDAEGMGGLELVVVPAGVRVLARRQSTSGAGEILTQDAAIDRYIDQELGPMCHGVRIRRS